MSTRFAVALLLAFPASSLLAPALLAQGEDAAPPPVPAAGSPAAAALLDRACSVMLKLPSGAFVSDEEQDTAMMRGRNLPMGASEQRVRGGWSSDLRWGDTEDDTFVVAAGRMVTKGRNGWKLRGRTLASGAQAPFLISPRLLFEQLQALSAADKHVVHTEADEVRGKPVTILTLQFTDDAAADLALGGALPSTGGGMMMSFGGMFGGVMPDKSYSVDMALSVDRATGEVLRLRTKVFQNDPMLANVQIKFGNEGDGDVESSDAGFEDDDGAGADNSGGKGRGAMQYKKGLPQRKPTKTESVAYLKVDFQDHGTAKAPAVDDNGQRWLGRK